MGWRGFISGVCDGLLRAALTQYLATRVPCKPLGKVERALKSDWNGLHWSGHLDNTEQELQHSLWSEAGLGHSCVFVSKQKAPFSRCCDS